MAVDETYFLRPGESTAAYNARIAAYNASKAQAPVSTPVTTTTTPSTPVKATTATPSGPYVDSSGVLHTGTGVTYTPEGNGKYTFNDGIHGSVSGASVDENYWAGIRANTSTVTQPISSSSGVQPPTVNLQPGDTGAQVKQLQDYLVSKGLMTQAQVNTGYGTYGPQTTTAVTALQKSLGVDNSTGVGYFGPRTIAAVSASAPGIVTGETGSTDPALATILANPNLSADQKATLQSIYGAISTNDADTAAKLQAAMKAASEFSDPYFKAQIRLATDALSRGLSVKEGDLVYAEKEKKAALDELRANTTASKDQLSFEHAQELSQLETKYETDLGTTRDNLAATGFTQSSKRARAEQILGEQNTGLVESSNKKFGYQTGNLDRALTASDASTQAAIENLRRLTSEGKLDLYRSTEQSVGSSNLPSVDGMTGLGDIGGTIPRKQVEDSLSFASNFVF